MTRILAAALFLAMWCTHTHADIVVGVGRNTLPTSITTVDITDSNIGGETVKGGFIVASYATANAGTVENHLVASIGVFDGTNEVVVGARSGDADGFTRSDRRGATDEVAQFLVDSPTTPSVEGEGNFSAIITNGVRVNVADAFASAHEVMAVLFAGADVQAAAGNLSINATLKTDVNIGFQPDVVLFFYNDTGVTDGNSIWARLYFGACLPGSTEHSVGFTDRDNVTTSENGLHYSNTDAMIEIGTTGAVVNTAACSTYASGFSVTGSASGWGEELPYLALKFTNGDAAIATHAVPATATTSTTSGLGFTPQAVILGLTNTSVNTNTEGVGMGISAFTSSVEIAHFWHAEDAQGTSDTGTLVDDATAVRTVDHTGASADVGTYSSFASGEFTVSYSAVDGNQNDFLAVIIGEYTGAAGTTLLQSLPAIISSER